MKKSKKYKEAKNSSMDNLVNHSQGDMELKSVVDENQQVVKKEKAQNKDVRINNNLL
ncbi:MAG: hypothetical protein ACRDA3_14345 [Peptostreptococcaceae bacterium]